VSTTRVPAPRSRGLLLGRVALVLVGVLVGLYGGYLLLQGQQGEALTSALVWIVGGVVVHDGLVAAIALVVGFVVSRLAPRVSRGPLAVGLVVLGTITVVAVPFVGRFGALPDNPTLLPRDYTTGYVVIVALVVVGVVAGVVLRARRAGRARPAGGDPEDAEDPA